MGHIIVILLHTIRENEEKRLWRCSVLLAELDSAATYSGEAPLLSSVQMLQILQHASTSVFTGAQVHHTAQSDSLQIKPQAGSALFLQLIK